jgi:hypothetical protein
MIPKSITKIGFCIALIVAVSFTSCYSARKKPAGQKINSMDNMLIKKRR